MNPLAVWHRCVSDADLTDAEYRPVPRHTRWSTDSSNNARPHQCRPTADDDADPPNAIKRWTRRAMSVINSALLTADAAGKHPNGRSDRRSCGPMPIAVQLEIESPITSFRKRADDKFSRAFY
jgi:hypothetical protein